MASPTPPVTSDTQTAAAVTYATAALIGIGGLAGFAKARSVPSLVSGLLIAGGLAYSASELQHSPTPVKGHEHASAISLALGGMMAIRAIRTKRLMPAGVVSLIGFGSAAYHGAVFYRIQQENVEQRREEKRRRNEQGDDGKW